MTKTIIIGGGCFWCTEAIFNELQGVNSVSSGYSGGQMENPDYRSVTTGESGHAEVIEVTYDPSIVSYKDIVLIHLTTHDPTTLNRQGADKGTQYRSVIFYEGNDEKAWAVDAVKEVQEFMDSPIVNELAPKTAYYIAEPYHQEYYKKNTNRAYCQAVINPKLTKFRKLYGSLIKKV